MGTDMHLVVEIKVEDRWELYTYTQPSRYYDAFNKLAGVRGEPQGGVLGKPGLPTDMSVSAKIISEHVHNQTSVRKDRTLDSDDICKFYEWWDRRNSPRLYDFSHLERWLHTYLFGNGFNFKDFPRHEIVDGVTDVRWVLFFD